MSHDALAKLDAIAESQTATRIDIAEIRRDVAHHIRRTEIAEEQLTELRRDLGPIKRHVTVVESLVKSVGVLSAFLGILKLVGVL
jgi:hypothetical protein